MHHMSGCEVDVGGGNLKYTHTKLESDFLVVLTVQISEVEVRFCTIVTDLVHVIWNMEVSHISESI